MPTYEYECDSCNHRFEVEQSMHDDPLTECPECAGSVRRVFGLSSVIFKGSGFYCNDVKKSGGSKKSSGADCATCPAATTGSSS